MYTLFYHIISICLLLQLSFTTCFIADEIRRTSHTRRKYRDAISNRSDDEELVPTVVDDGPNAFSGETSDFLKKSLVEFFSGVKSIGDTHSYLSNAKKRTLRARLLKHKHLNSLKKEKRRDVDSKGKNNSTNVIKLFGTKNPKCKFPFIYDGKSVFSCLRAGRSKEKWCSLTSNFDRDAQWYYCSNDDNPVRRSKSSESSTNGSRIIGGSRSARFDDSDLSGKKTDSNDIRKYETDRQKNDKSSLSDEICDTCDRLPKANSDAAVKDMQRQINNVEKSNNEIHSLVSKEVDKFIGSVLSKHGVPDTEQKELLALNAKLSTELAQEVSCKISNDSNGRTRSECGKVKDTATSVGRKKNEGYSNQSSTNQTSNNGPSPNEVDAFISSVLSQNDISIAKQNEILKSIRKASTDIADQIDYVVSYAKAGRISSKNNDKIREQSTTKGNKTSTKKGIHEAVNNFLSLALKKHGVTPDAQKEIFKWNAQLSNDIAYQVNTIIENAKGRKKDHTRQYELKARLKPNITMDTRNTGSHSNNSSDNFLEEDKETNSAVNDSPDAGSKSLETKSLSDKPQQTFVKEESHPGHKDHIHSEKGLYDVDNDMEIGIHDMGLSVGASNDGYRGKSADVVDMVALNNDESISPPAKFRNHHDNDEENMTLFANKEFNKKPQIHAKRKNAGHKKMMADENWDKYLMDDGWPPHSDKMEDTSKSDGINKEDNQSSSGEKELNDDEKTMINYVSDSIIESVKSVKKPANKPEEKELKGKGRDVTYKKLDSGKKPYLIYRLQQSKHDGNLIKSPGIDRIETKSQQIIPGAKNINIIIINNRNSSLDLSDIENTIARSSDPSESKKASGPTTANIGNAEGNSSSPNKTSENLFLLINTTDKTIKPKSELNSSSEISTVMNSSSSDSNESSLPTNATDASRTLTTMENMENITNTSLPTAVNMTDNHTSIENHTETNRTENKLSEVLPSDKENRNLNFSKILTEYDKDLEASTTQSLRKSGLISMNYAPEGADVRTFGGNANGGKCMFPFIYDGDTYFNCIINSNHYHSRPWCSITANYDKTPIWGFCDNDHTMLDQVKKNGNPSVGEIQSHKQQMLHNLGEELISKHSGIKTYGGNANAAPCVIPFVYDGQTHMKCIPRHDGTSWCAASHSYDIHPVWGNCCDNDVYKC